MFDSRLVGTWRSDLRRTTKDIEARRDIPANSRRSLVRLFGRLTLRYTRTRCYSTLDGSTDNLSYRVLAKNSDEVVVAGLSSVTGELSIHHIHFEGRYYWISLGAFREYFRRLPGARRAPRQPTARKQA